MDWYLYQIPYLYLVYRIAFFLYLELFSSLFLFDRALFLLFQNSFFFFSQISSFLAQYFFLLYSLFTKTSFFLGLNSFPSFFSHFLQIYFAVEEGEGEDLFIRGSHSPEWSLAFPCRAQAKRITHGQCCQLLAKFSGSSEEQFGYKETKVRPLLIF